MLNKRATIKRKVAKPRPAMGMARGAARATRRGKAEAARIHNYLAEKHPEMELFSLTI